MSQEFRITSGGLIDRSKEISFIFNGKKYNGYKGDTLASALLANGVHLIGRSFKYHRPRGIIAAGVEDANGKVQLYKDNITEPNVNVTEVELVEGLRIESQNCWPSVNFDVGGINNFLNRFFPAGFYYKTFMWPKSFWYHVYEPFIRKAAGMGKASLDPDPDRYEHQYEHCDILVVGSGPSGIASALSAAKNGASVILAEDKARFGGSLLTDNVTIGNKNGDEWVEDSISELKSMPNVIVKKRSQVFGYYDHNMLVMFERCKDHLDEPEPYTPRQRLWYIRAKHVVISTGSIERPLIFANNDRPGIMLATSAREYLKVYGVLPGKNPIIFTNNDSAYETAIEFKAYGIDTIILDTRKSSDAGVVQEAKNLGIEIKFNHGIANTTGYKKVKSATIGELTESKDGYKNLTIIPCDSIFVSGNWTPTVHLASQSGNKLKYESETDTFLPDQSRQKETVTGSANGLFTLKESLADGFNKGYQISDEITKNGRETSVPYQMKKILVLTINSGVCQSQITNTTKGLLIFKMMLLFQIFN